MTDAFQPSPAPVPADRDAVAAVLREVTAGLDAFLAVERPADWSDASVLYGEGGILDSLGLVHLIIGAEQAIQDAFGVPLTLASEQAVSRQRSPFRSIDAMADYVWEMMKDARHG